MRLDKYLSNNTNHSRSTIKSFIKNKRVLVNGNVITEPKFTVISKDVITLKGIEIKDMSNMVIYIDKPKGYITSTSEKDGESVMNLLPDEYKGLGFKPIGRLDKDTTGILLFTNNDALIHEMTSKYNKHKKVYEVTLADEVQEGYKALVESGIKLRNGYRTKPGKYRRLSAYKVQITITDGKYHQVKRMFAAMGNRVIELRRIKFGKYSL